MKPISIIAKSIAPSATLAISTLSNKMKAEGIDVIGFGAGEPDFNTPEHIKDAGIEAIKNNKTRYTPAAGIPELRKAVCRSLADDYGLIYTPKQICVSSGAKHNIFITLQVLLNPGDEVILPAPFWVTYEEAIKMSGGVPIILNTTEETNFKITSEMLLAAITEKTKCLILNNPSNPTGMVYAREELEAIARVIVEKDIYVISDEIYCALTYVGENVPFASLGADVKERTIIINGVSKSYAMTGWRIGYSASNEEIASAMSNYLDHSTSSACTVSQYASLVAIESDQSEKFEMKKAFDQRRKYMIERIKNIEGVSCLEPEGAFYVFMNVKPQFGRTLFGMKIENSDDFSSCLLKNGLVAVVSGSAFGADGYVRWSYATSMDNISKGLDRLENFLKEIPTK